jgi:hypothetical protein
MNDNKEARSISADRRPIQVSIHDGDSPKVSNRNGVLMSAIAMDIVLKPAFPIDITLIIK